MWSYNYTNELYHHGIKGMKWGVRRYQNENGTLTPEGKKRSKQKGWSNDAKEVRAIRKKSVNSMSNDELRKLNERTRLEQEYRRLNPSFVSRGKKFIIGGIGLMGTAVGAYNNFNNLVKIGKKFIK